jgi:hypothetical protein
MSSQNIIFSSIKLISLENKFSKKPKMFFSISEEQYNSLPNCSKSSKVKDGEKLFGVSCSPIDDLQKYEKYFRYDLKVAFVPYNFNGKQGVTAYCKILRSHGLEQLENKSKAMALKLLMDD